MLVSDTIAYSLRLAGVLGVGQVALPLDLEDTYTALQLMLSQWQRKRWLVYRLFQASMPAVPGKPDYSLGLGLPTDLVIERPGTIENVFLRQLVGSGPDSFPVDYPLSRIDSREEWNRIPLKNLRSWPGSWFYDPTLPNGTLYIWPIPIQTFFEIHLAVPQNIIVGADVDLADYLPAEAEEAIVYNLAARLRIMYQLPPNPDVAALARATLNTLRTTNFAMRPLGMPAALRGSGRLRNPMAGFFPIETAIGIGFPVLR